MENKLISCSIVMLICITYLSNISFVLAENQNTNVPLESSKNTLSLHLTLDGNLNDVSNHQNHGTWRDGDPSYLEGVIGQASSFDGSHDGSYVFVEDDNSLRGMEELTIALWVKKHTINHGGTVLLKHAHYKIEIGENSFFYYIANEDLELVYKTINVPNHDDQWHHYAISFDGTMVTSWFDGSSIRSDELVGAVRDDETHDMYIGKDPWGDTFNGLIDELRIYNESLTEDEIQEVMGCIDPPQTFFEISRHGITWTFDQHYEYGQFVNGDWWVVPHTPNETVTIVDITRPHNTPGLDGSMINPIPGNDQQGYDARTTYAGAEYYNPDLDVARSLSDEPLVLAPNTSLISTISWHLNDPDCPPINPTTQTPRPLLRVASVLTVLPTPPSENTFRPGYAGAEKRIFSAADVRFDLLPTLDPPSSAPAFSTLEQKFEKVWLDHGIDYFFTEYLHPSENLPGYGQYMAEIIGKTALLLLLDYPQEQKETLTHALIQLGLDLYSAADNGCYWPGNGGHASGRKFPILFAGLMLDDLEMLGIGYREKTPTSWRFGEDDQTYYVTNDIPDGSLDGLSTYERSYTYQLTNKLAVGGTHNTIQLNLPDSDYEDSYTFLNHIITITSGTGTGQSRTIVDRSQWFSGQILGVAPDWEIIPNSDSMYSITSTPQDFLAIGTPEYGIKHYNEPSRDNHAFTQSAYRQCCNAATWGTYVLAAHALDLKDDWNHDALFDYQDRYSELMPVGDPFRFRTDFAEDMWNAYRPLYDEEDFEFLIESEFPENASQDISINCTKLSVNITHRINRSFSWSIETCPNVGSNHGFFEPNGEKICDISNLEYAKTYKWYVNVSDANSEQWSSTLFLFTTAQLSTPPTDNEGFTKPSKSSLPPGSRIRPQADAGGPYFGYVNESLEVDGSESKNFNGDTLFYRWDFFNDQSWDTPWMENSTTSYFYTAAGNYTIAIQVKDEHGLTDRALTHSIITVQDSQQSTDDVDVINSLDGSTSKIDPDKSVKKIMIRYSFNVTILNVTIDMQPCQFTTSDYQTWTIFVPENHSQNGNYLLITMKNDLNQIIHSQQYINFFSGEMSRNEHTNPVRNEYIGVMLVSIGIIIFSFCGLVYLYKRDTN